MKKILLLIIVIFLLSGCGKQRVTCTYEDEDASYDNKRTLEITFEKDHILNFKSTIVEEYKKEKDAINSYIAYQSLYNNYNENNVVSSYRKNKLKVTAIYNIDLRDIENEKIDFEFDFTKNQNDFLKELNKKGFSCK